MPPVNRPTPRRSAAPVVKKGAVKPSVRVNQRAERNAASKELGERLASVMDLADFARDAMIRYGTKTNEDRSIPSYQDGLKPVQRRSIYAARNVVVRQGKTARLVGEVIGTLHPHGDASVADAIAKMVGSEVPIFEGFGNWGSLLDPPASMRYTELKLSTYGHQFIHPDYLPIVPMVANYDDRDQEPVFLPALLPNILLNPTWGIGTGTNTTIPAFTPKSLLPVIIKMLDGADPTGDQLARALKFSAAWGGDVPRDKATFQTVSKLMDGGHSATIPFQPTLEINERAKSITMTGAPPNLNLETFVRKVRLLKPVASVDPDRRGVAYTIRTRRGTSDNLFKMLVQRVLELGTGKVSYAIYVAKRTPCMAGDKPSYSTQFFRYSVKELINAWIQFRMVLEARSLRHRLERVQAQIYRLRLMAHACDHLDVIFKALRMKNTAELIAKGLKISLEDAKIILELRVRQLSALDKQKVLGLIAEARKLEARLKAMLKDPAISVKAYLETALESFEQSEYVIANCHQWRMKSTAALKAASAGSDGSFVPSDDPEDEDAGE